ncbi:hypothetical protein GCM10009609_49250 [Pseudonocardia aurantiaca]|uniref:Uncharacterized protein n=1 Tax=Pseudonocardia aurantiaca TaxID=75290 RepID=A0ABW4FVF1_9PSEU
MRWREAGGGPGSVPLAPAFSAPAPGGPAGFAPFYGGMIPPSLMGNNPAGAQLRQRAAQNLALRAETAQRFNAIASGNPSAAPAVGAASGPAAPAAGYGYLPPMGGGMAPMGMGAAAGGRGGKRGRKRMVSEPASVWGATGRGTRGKAKEQSTAGTEVVEDADVWTGGPTDLGPGVLGGR